MNKSTPASCACRILKSLPPFLAVSVLAASLVVPAGANTVTYTYVGNPFTFTSNQLAGDYPQYSTSDLVTGTITFAAPLTESFGDQSADVVSYSFSDVAHTITSTMNPNQVTLDFGTDGAGDITQWYIDLRCFSCAGQPADWYDNSISLEWEQYPYSASGFIGGDVGDIGVFSPSHYNQGGNGTGGTWTEESSATPEPATWTSMLLAAGAVLAVRRRAHRRLSRPGGPWWKLALRGG
jgi:PEP-CTERM motif-containing protein